MCVHRALLLSVQSCLCMIMISLFATDAIEHLSMYVLIKHFPSMSAMFMYDHISPSAGRGLLFNPGGKNHLNAPSSMSSIRGS